MSDRSRLQRSVFQVFDVTDASWKGERTISVQGTSQALVQMTLLILIDTLGSVLMENELDVRNVQDTSHHAGAFSCWLAGTGVKQAMVSGETDDDGMKVTKAPVRIHDFYATILHLPGMNPHGSRRQRQRSLRWEGRGLYGRRRSHGPGDGGTAERGEVDGAPSRSSIPGTVGVDGFNAWRRFRSRSGSNSAADGAHHAQYRRLDRARG